MLFPVYIHTDDASHAHGVIIPDFPGCFSAADRWNDLPAMIQEAVELHCEDEDMVLPKPSSLDDLIASGEYENGLWMMIDIDLSQLKTRSVRLNVSLPEGLLRRIDNEAKTRHMSRSAFLAMSAQQVLEAQ